MDSPKKSVLKALLWFGLIVLVVAGGFAAWLIIPIVTSSTQGSSGQELNVQGYPSSVTATGEDGRIRTLSVVREGATDQGLEGIVAGDRLVVTGSGYNASAGIYVAICQVPSDKSTRPGPCLGGVPETAPDGEVVADVVEYAASNWVNDDWAWRLFGARSFDDRAAGTFRAYIEVPGFADEGVDCLAVRCGLYTRNDHTAIDDRVQDLYIPISFAR